MSSSLLNTQEVTQNWPTFIHIMEATLEKPTFETCLKQATSQKVENDCITIQVPNEFAKERLETKYKELITQTLRNIMNNTERFARQQKRDKYLREYCQENNIILLEIDGRSYYGDKIKTYLQSKLLPLLTN